MLRRIGQPQQGGLIYALLPVLGSLIQDRILDNRGRILPPSRGDELNLWLPMWGLD